MNPIIRNARSEDAATIAYLMYLAGRGHVRTSVLDLLFPGEPGATPERLEQVEGLVSAQTRSMFHYSFYRVAEVDGEAALEVVRMAGRRFALLQARQRWRASRPRPLPCGTRAARGCCKLQLAVRV